MQILTYWDSNTIGSVHATVYDQLSRLGTLSVIMRPDLEARGKLTDSALLDSVGARYREEYAKFLFAPKGESFYWVGSDVIPLPSSMETLFPPQLSGVTCLKNKGEILHTFHSDGTFPYQKLRTEYEMVLSSKVQPGVARLALDKISERAVCDNVLAVAPGTLGPARDLFERHNATLPLYVVQNQDSVVIMLKEMQRSLVSVNRTKGTTPYDRLATKRPPMQLVAPLKQRVGCCSASDGCNYGIAFRTDFMLSHRLKTAPQLEDKFVYSKCQSDLVDVRMLGEDALPSVVCDNSRCACEYIDAVSDEALEIISLEVAKTIERDDDTLVAKYASMLSFKAVAMSCRIDAVIEQFYKLDSCPEEDPGQSNTTHVTSSKIAGVQFGYTRNDMKLQTLTIASDSAIFMGDTLTFEIDLECKTITATVVSSTGMTIKLQNHLLTLLTVPREVTVDGKPFLAIKSLTSGQTVLETFDGRQLNSSYTPSLVELVHPYEFSQRLFLARHLVPYFTSLVTYAVMYVPTVTPPPAPPLPPPSPPNAPPPPDGQAVKDPHLSLANGGRADFRGIDKTIFSFVSSKDFALNVMTEDTDFHLGSVLVHGSFLTQVHMSVRADSGRFFNISMVASDVNEQGWSWQMATGSCAFAPRRVPFKMGPKSEKKCDNLMALVDLSSLYVHTPEWLIRVTNMPVYKHVSGPTRRLDLTFHPRSHKFVVRPHGIVGQSFDGSPVARQGNVDNYPDLSIPSEFTTTAMAEGAIDGEARDYIVSTPFQTAFKYSKFDSVADAQPTTVQPGLSFAASTD